MSTAIKIALIAAATVIGCVGACIYYSPLHTCIRDTDKDVDWCVRAVSPKAAS
jgi:hypothetical protein